MADSIWRPRPLRDWETISNVPWGGICFSDSSTLEYSESQADSEIDRENILEVKYPRMYTVIAPVLQKPQVLGSYSNDKMGNNDFGNHPPLAIDRHFLPHTGTMKVRLHLNKGIENYNAGSYSNKMRFHDLLRWILENQSSLKTSCNKNAQKLCLDFISDMCNLTRAMRTPYNVKEAWCMGAVEYKGTIYLRRWFPPKRNTSPKVSTPLKDSRKPLQPKNDGFLLNEKNRSMVSVTPTMPKKIMPLNDFFPLFERQKKTTVEVPIFQRNLHSSDVVGYKSLIKTSSQESICSNLNSSRSSSHRWNSSKESSLEEANIWLQIFKHIVRGGDPDGEVDGSIEYHCVLKTALGPNTLLYSPSMDCVDPDKFTKNFDYLDAFLSVKCCPQIDDKMRRKSQRKYKLNQWWSEKLLTGIPRMLVGFRNEEGIVNSLELLTMNKILEEAQGEWDPKVCLTFLQEFLEFVKTMLKKYPGKTLSFEYKARGDIRCKILKDHDLLPLWYKCKLYPE